MAYSSGKPSRTAQNFDGLRHCPRTDRTGTSRKNETVFAICPVSARKARLAPSRQVVIVRRAAYHSLASGSARATCHPSEQLLKTSDVGSIPIARSINPVDAVGFTGFPSRKLPLKPMILDAVGRGFGLPASNWTQTLGVLSTKELKETKPPGRTKLLTKVNVARKAERTHSRTEFSHRKGIERPQACQ